MRLPADSDSVKRAQRTNHVQNCAFILALEDNLLKISNLELVEAAGVEPASEIAVSQESPCSVRFRMFSPLSAQNGQDAPEASPMISSYNTDRAATTSLLCDVRSQPVGKAVEDGYLVN